MREQGYSKRAWQRIIRESAPADGRQPCFVCGQHQFIAHVHHIIPVHQMAELLGMMQVGPHDVPDLSVPCVWLCPNHHAIWHKLNGKGPGTIEIYEALTDGERAQYGKIHEMEQAAWKSLLRLKGE